MFGQKETQPEPQNTIDFPRIYESIWRNMERENALINFRIQWAITLSGGILATEGILTTSLKNSFEPSSDDFVHGVTLLLMFVLSSIAVFFCYKSKEGVWAAQDQINELRKKYESFYTKDGNNVFEADFKLPRPFGSPISHEYGHITAVTFPKVLLAIWIIFAALQFTGSVILLHRATSNTISHINMSPSEKKTDGGEQKTSVPAKSETEDRDHSARRHRRGRY